MVPTWNSSGFGMEIQSNGLNSGPEEQLPNCFFNPNWDNLMDQSDPFESALSSIVSSPAASNAAGVPGNPNRGGGDGCVLTELIGRLGSICNSGEISAHSYIGGNNSTNTSCYSTPLNSPPKLNLSMMDHKIRGNRLPGNHLPTQPTLAHFSADPGFAERAVRFSCFGSRSLGGLNGQFGYNESEFPNRLAPRMESGKLSRVPSNQSIKVSGSPMGVLENKDVLFREANSGSDKKFATSTYENGEFGDSREESSVSEQIPGGEFGLIGQGDDANGRKRKSIPRGKGKETPSSTSPAKDAKIAPKVDESNPKRSKPDEATGNGKDSAKENVEENGNGKQKQTKDIAKPQEPPKDYIHVRARRGQATDSHSLAERVRREKISERMKFLQDLVPGCNKVTGKAVMLDEIINYVQSLQRQVEFLSMKLSTVNPGMDFNMEAFLSKDIFQSRGSINPHNNYPFETTSPAFSYGFQSPQGPHLHGGILSVPETCSLNPLNAAPRRIPSTNHPPINGFGEATSQGFTFWEDDLQSVVQMGFGQNQPQNLHGTGQMKVEL
ncbi:hypothetical protein U1Q18_030575 [Sarracenia purpurea var. burkii]